MFFTITASSSEELDPDSKPQSKSHQENIQVIGL